MRHLCFLLRAPALVMLALSAIVSTAVAGELPADFVERYVPAAAKLERAYTHATIRGHYAQSFPRNVHERRGPNGLALALSFTLETDGARISMAERNGFDYPDGHEKDRIPRDWQMTADWARFREGGGPWEVAELADARSYIDSVTGVRLSYGPGLLDRLRDPIRTIDRIEEVVEEDRRIVRITCHWDAEGSTPLRNTGTYDLSPSEGWALRRYVNAWRGTRGDAPGRYELFLDYQGEQKGVPLLRRAEEIYSHGPNFDPEQRIVVDVTDIQFNAPSSRQL